MKTAEEIILSGLVEVSPSESSYQFDGKCYVSIWGCDTMDHYRDLIAEALITEYERGKREGAEGRLTIKETGLAAALLDRAGNVFSNHGCNDFILGEHVDMDDDEMRALDLAIHQWNGDPEEHDPSGDHKYQTDFCLMNYLAAKIRRADGDGGE